MCIRDRFLLLSLPIYFLLDGDIVGLCLKEALAAVVYVGYTFVLDLASRAEAPELKQLGVIMALGRDRLLLLVASGVGPVLFGLLVLYVTWGADQTSAFLADLARGPGKESPAMAFDLWVVETVASIPFTFMAPVCALYRWSASRSMGANLLACAVNWRWVLVTTAVFAAADRMLVLLSHQGPGPALLALAGVLAMQAFSLSWILALTRLSFPPR